MDALARAQRYRDYAEESVAFAKAAISNEMRAQHYAIAQHFHLLAEAELKAATSSPSIRGVRPWRLPIAGAAFTRLIGSGLPSVERRPRAHSRWAEAVKFRTADGRRSLLEARRPLPGSPVTTGAVVRAGYMRGEWRRTLCHGK